ncbi:MAG: type II toxin-antitoxin system VapC family toxin [Alphaproteobacteria bacterium]|nr:type II toxin-antitoxin system VapC family toxin [Alphaproteobacteria bacterium]
MRYLFDTNACIALLNDSSSPLRERLHRLAPADVDLPAPVAYELYYGAYKSRHADRNLGLLDRLEFEIVPFDAGDAREAGAVRSELEAAGLPIGPYDLLIAGQARARNLVLVTANSREFERVQGLVCEDWMLSDADS